MKKQLLKFGAIVLLGAGAIKLALIILSWLVMFLLVGVVPGTSYSVPPSIMLLGTVTAMWLLVIVVASYGRLFSATPDDTETEVAKATPRRRRYTDV